MNQGHRRPDANFPVQHRKQRGLVPEDTLEWGLVSRGIQKRVVGTFPQHDYLTPGGWILGR